MSLARSGVESVGDFVALGLREMFEAGSLRQVLANEAVEVLVAAALPGVVRSGEVAPQRGTRLEHLVVMELGAVVEGDRLEGRRVLLDRVLDSGRGFSLVARTK